MATRSEDVLHGDAGPLFRASYRPPGEVWGRLLLVHGYGDHCGRHSEFLEYAADQGVLAQGIDLRGQGRSSGLRGHVERWEQYVDDLAVAANADAPSGCPAAPFFLLGHSHGALVVVAAVLSERASPTHCILTAPYFAARHQVPGYKVALGRCVEPLFPAMRLPSGLPDHWMSRDPERLRDSRRDPLLVRTATPRWYFRSLEAQAQLRESAPNWRLPLLALIGSDDPVADPAAAREYCRNVPGPDVTFEELPGMLHEILREVDRRRVFELILGWMRARATGEDATAVSRASSSAG